MNQPKPILKGEPHCPKCKETCKPRYIGESLVFDCQGCKDQISSTAIEYWRA